MKRSKYTDEQLLATGVLANDSYFFTLSDCSRARAVFNMFGTA
jgi:hypothetical protein